MKSENAEVEDSDADSNDEEDVVVGGGTIQAGEMKKI